MAGASAIQELRVEDRSVRRRRRSYKLISIECLELSPSGVKLVVELIGSALPRGKQALLVQIKDGNLANDMCYWEIFVSDLRQLLRGRRPLAVIVPVWASERIDRSRVIDGGLFTDVSGAEQQLEHWPTA